MDPAETRLVDEPVLVAEPAGFAPPEASPPPPSPAPVAEELDGDGGLSGRLACGLFDPMPGGIAAGYAADTGLDLAGTPRDVYAIASGTLEYAEGGHTAWNGKHDSPYAIRLRLDVPIEHGGHRITHVWYAHLSELAREVKEGSGEIVHVAAGRRLGRSGSANGSPHLHLGMLLDDQVEQAWGTFLLEDEVRSVLCDAHKGRRLPGAEPQKSAGAPRTASRVARASSTEARYVR